MLINVTDPYNGPVTYRILGKSCVAVSFRKDSEEIGLETLTNLRNELNQSDKSFIYLNRLPGNWITVGISTDIKDICANYDYTTAEVFLSTDTVLRDELIANAGTLLHNKLFSMGFGTFIEELPTDINIPLIPFVNDFVNDCLDIMLMRYPEIKSLKLNNSQNKEEKKRGRKKKAETIIDAEIIEDDILTQIEQNIYDNNILNSVQTEEEPVSDIYEKKEIHRSRRSLPERIDGEIFVIQSNKYDVNAECVIRDGKYVLLSGSVLEPKGKGPNRTSIFPELIELNSEGKTILKEELEFTSPSAVASFCTGVPTSGYKMLRNKNTGLKLDSYFNDTEIKTIKKSKSKPKQKKISKRDYTSQNNYRKIVPGSIFFLNVYKNQNEIEFDGTDFILKSGAHIRKETSPSYLKDYGARNFGEMTDNGDWITTIGDRKFKSISSLYGWCMGCVGNAGEKIKDADGTPLKDIIKKQIS